MRGKFAMPFIAALLLLATVGGTASAAPPDGLESYDAGADASALDLNVGLLDLQVASGITKSTISSQGPVANGDGTALLLAGTGNGIAASAAPAGPESARACVADEELPAPLDLLGLAIACVNSAASLVDGAPVATANSEAITIPIGGAELTEQLLGALLPGLDQVLAPLGALLAGLNDVTCALTDLLNPALDPLRGALTSLGLELTDETLDVLCSLTEIPSILDALLASLGNALSTTVVITVAPNSTLVSADDQDGVIAAAVAQGATIEVLPGIGPNDSAFLEVIVGSAEASVVRDATTGEAVAEANPAVAEINVNGIDLGVGAIADLGLGNLLDPVTAFVNNLVNTLATASPLACGEPGPLAEILCLDAAAGFVLDAAEAAAEGYDFGEGTVGARTSALRLELLSLLNGGEPAVSLALAEATAAANATPAGAVAPPSTETPVTLQQLPRTGSSDLTGLVVALGLGLAAVAIGARRRATR